MNKKLAPLDAKRVFTESRPCAAVGCFNNDNVLYAVENNDDPFLYYCAPCYLKLFQESISRIELDSAIESCALNGIEELIGKIKALKPHCKYPDRTDRLLAILNGITGSILMHESDALSNHVMIFCQESLIRAKQRKNSYDFPEIIEDEGEK